MSSEIKIVRDRGIDILRGIAVFTMILSNVAGELLIAPHPFLLRIIGSLAAPLFVTIFAYMIAYSFVFKERNYIYILKRMGIILTVAVLLDIFIWGVYPFLTLDILYLIALSTPIIHYSMKLPISYRLLLALGIIGLAPFLQDWFGYLKEAPDLHYYVNGELMFYEQLTPVYILLRTFIDGLFPLFPWVGIALLGTAVMEWREKERDFRKNLLIYVFSFLLLTTGIIMWDMEFRLEERGGYSEFFYPPTISYFLCYIGISLFLERIFVKERAFFKYLQIFELLGKRSLLYYIFHFIMLGFIFVPIHKSILRKFDLSEYCITAFGIIAICYLLGLLLERFSEKLKNLPLFFKVIMGG
jgi:uncharacterized membrane protein